MVVVTKFFFFFCFDHDVVTVAKKWKKNSLDHDMVKVVEDVDVVESKSQSNIFFVRITL